MRDGYTICVQPCEVRICAQAVVLPGIAIDVGLGQVHRWRTDLYTNVKIPRGRVVEFHEWS
jgi:hypothetical protein